MSELNSTALYNCAGKNGAAFQRPGPLRGIRGASLEKDLGKGTEMEYGKRGCREGGREEECHDSQPMEGRMGMTFMNAKNATQRRIVGQVNKLKGQMAVTVELSKKKTMTINTHSTKPPEKKNRQTKLRCTVICAVPRRVPCHAMPHPGSPILCPCLACPSIPKHRRLADVIYIRSATVPEIKTDQ